MTFEETELWLKSLARQYHLQGYEVSAKQFEELAKKLRADQEDLERRAQVIRAVRGYMARYKLHEYVPLWTAMASTLDVK